VNLNTSSLLHHVEAHSGVECDHRGVEFDTPLGVEYDHQEVEFNTPGVEFDTFHPSLRSDPPFGL